jgi:hypothetical protein
LLSPGVDDVSRRLSTPPVGNVHAMVKSGLRGRFERRAKPAASPAAARSIRSFDAPSINRSRRARRLVALVNRASRP